MAGLQSKFENLIAKVNQGLAKMLTDGRKDHKPELLCNPANEHHGVTEH